MKERKLIITSSRCIHRTFDTTDVSAMDSTDPDFSESDDGMVTVPSKTVKGDGVEIYLGPQHRTQIRKRLDFGAAKDGAEVLQDMRQDVGVAGYPRSAPEVQFL